MSPHPPAEGADESIVSSSPFLHSRPWYPSSGTSDGHVTSSPRRRCRRKRRFIVTFPALAAVVSRSQAPLTALSPHPPQKVPTKATFHRHLPALAAVVSRPQAPLTALSPHLPAEGADESDVSSSPSGTRNRGTPSSARCSVTSPLRCAHENPATRKDLPPSAQEGGARRKAVGGPGLFDCWIFIAYLLGSEKCRTFCRRLILSVL